MAKEISFKLVKHIAVLSDKSSGWRKELNIISWNDGEPKYDIRDWAPAHEKMGKGTTLTGEEADLLVQALIADDSGIVE